MFKQRLIIIYYVPFCFLLIESRRIFIKSILPNEKTMETVTVYSPTLSTKELENFETVKKFSETFSDKKIMKNENFTKHDIKSFGNVKPAKTINQAIFYSDKFGAFPIMTFIIFIFIIIDLSLLTVVLYLLLYCLYNSRSNIFCREKKQQFSKYKYSPNSSVQDDELAKKKKYKYEISEHPFLSKYRILQNLSCSMSPETDETRKNFQKIQMYRKSKVNSFSEQREGLTLLEHQDKMSYKVSSNEFSSLKSRTHSYSGRSIRADELSEQKTGIDSQIHNGKSPVNKTQNVEKSYGLTEFGFKVTATGTKSPPVIPEQSIQKKDQTQYHIKARQIEATSKLMESSDGVLQTSAQYGELQESNEYSITSNVPFNEIEKALPHPSVNDNSFFTSNELLPYIDESETGMQDLSSKLFDPGKYGTKSGVEGSEYISVPGKYGNIVWSPMSPPSPLRGSEERVVEISSDKSQTEFDDEEDSNGDDEDDSSDYDDGEEEYKSVSGFPDDNVVRLAALAPPPPLQQLTSKEFTQSPNFTNAEDFFKDPKQVDVFRKHSQEISPEIYDSRKYLTNPELHDKEKNVVQDSKILSPLRKHLVIQSKQSKSEDQCFKEKRKVLLPRRSHSHPLFQKAGEVVMQTKVDEKNLYAWKMIQEPKKKETDEKNFVSKKKLELTKRDDDILQTEPSPNLITKIEDDKDETFWSEQQIDSPEIHDEETFYIRKDSVCSSTESEDSKETTVSELSDDDYDLEKMRGLADSTLKEKDNIDMNFSFQEQLESIESDDFEKISFITPSFKEPYDKDINFSLKKQLVSDSAVHEINFTDLEPLPEELKTDALDDNVDIKYYFSSDAKIRSDCYNGYMTDLENEDSSFFENGDDDDSLFYKETPKFNSQAYTQSNTMFSDFKTENTSNFRQYYDIDDFCDANSGSPKFQMQSNLETVPKTTDFFYSMCSLGDTDEEDVDKEVGTFSSSVKQNQRWKEIVGRKILPVLKASTKRNSLEIAVPIAIS